MKTEETKVEATPGPWRTRKSKTLQDLVSHYVESEGANLAICKILKDQYRTNIEAEANAKLIAAAPDLLSACKYALKMLHMLDVNTGDKGDQAYQAIESAIKRATE